MPFIDAGIHHPQYKVIQRVGVTGILKGKGIPFQWANQTWFYPDSTITGQAFLEGLQSFNPAWAKGITASNTALSTEKATNMIVTLAKKLKLKGAHQLSNSKMIAALKTKALYTENIQRKALAWLLDTYINPFNTPINHQGKIASH